jgi:hypothetical protein
VQIERAWSPRCREPIRKSSSCAKAGRVDRESSRGDGSMWLDAAPSRPACHAAEAGVRLGKARELVSR